MRKDLTEVVFVLDASGSMSSLEADTIGGFNSMIAKQKKEEGEAYISTVLFNSRSRVLHDRVPVRNVRLMTSDDYVASGSTALMDAVGDAIRHIRNVHKYAREEDVPEKTLFVIMTDGMENSSTNYNVREIRSMIEHQKRKHDWEFMFLGANIDAEETAQQYGIKKENAVNFHNDEQGVALNYQVLSGAVGRFRSTSKLDDDWRERIDEDYQSRL